MKKLFLFFGLFLAVTSIASAQIVLEGKYQGKNLYVVNPFASSGVGFCVSRVLVNGEVTTDEINSSAFEIDLSYFQLELGATVRIEIEHKEDCLPKVLNPQVLRPRATFDIVNIRVDRSGKLTWTTSGESGSLPYVIEQYRWNKWVTVGEIQGTGKPGESSYDFQVAPHSGTNRVRVKQIDFNNRPKYSQQVQFRSAVPEVDFFPKKVDKEINFVTIDGDETETMYEIYDKFGNLVMKGVGAKINVSNLEGGVFYINYDMKVETFFKRK